MAEEVRLAGIWVDLRARTSAFAAGFLDADKRLAAHQRQLRRNRRQWRSATRDLRQFGRQTTSIRNVGIAGVAAAGGLALLIREQGRYADELRSNARLSDQSIESLQVWTAALASARNDQDSVADGFRELALRQREAIDGNLDVAHAARLAGLRLEDEAGNARDVRDILYDLARIIPTLTHGTGVSILDRLGGEDLQLLYGVLSQGTAELDRRLADARRTARRLTDEQADSLVELSETMDRLAIAARSALGAAVADNAGRIDGLLQDIEGRLPAILDGFLSFTERAADGFELLLEHGRELLGILAAVRGAGIGSGAGAAVGSLFGPVGTAVGTVAGGVLGAAGAGGGAYYGLGQLGAGGSAPAPAGGARGQSAFTGASHFRGFGGAFGSTPVGGSAPAPAGVLGGGGGLLVTASAEAEARASGDAAAGEYLQGLQQGISSRRRELEVALGRALEVPAELLDLDARSNQLATELERVRRLLAGIVEDSDEAIQRKAELTLQETALGREIAGVEAGRRRVTSALQVEADLVRDLDRTRAAARDEEMEFLESRAEFDRRWEAAVQQQAAALERQRETVRQVSYAFASFTTDAIRGVDSLSDRIRQLATEITDLLTQRLLVEPLVNYIAGELVPGGGGGLGGGRTVNNYLSISSGVGSSGVAEAGNALLSDLGRELELS